MIHKLRKAGMALSAVALITLAACGGDDDTTAGTPPPGGGTNPPVATTTSVPVTVVDGAVGNALVCVDKNSNGVCDAGETSGRTDAAGNISLQVPNADVGKYPILAIVGTDAVDADHGPVTVAYSMSAPADKPAVVSPLTTLVQTVIASTGASSAAAEAAVQAQTGLTVSLFQDFTKSTAAASVAAGTVARMVVVVTQQQNTAIASAAGTTAIDGAVITKADLDEAVQKKLLELLPALITALGDPAVQNAATPAAKEAALAAAAGNIVTTSGLTTASVATVVAVNNQTSSTAPTTPEAPTATFTLAAFNYYGTNNWYSRGFAGTAAMNTPDASGNTRYIERRARTTPSPLVTVRWNTGSTPNRQSDLHFDGTNWVNCGLNSQDIATKRIAGQANDYDYCHGLETGKQTRAEFDISGRTVRSVYAQVQAAGYGNISIAGGTATIASSATFPANAKLFYQTNTPLTNAPAYDRNADNRVRFYNANLQAGSATPNPSAPCAAANVPGPTIMTNLTELTANFPGNGCVISTSPRNENWGYTSLGVGKVGNVPLDPSGSSASYTGNTSLRVAFSGTNVKYLSCAERLTDGSSRNCDVIGTGTFTITTMGDAKVLTLNGQPTIFTALNYERVYVERAGRVFAGYKNRPIPTNQARFNLAATNALFGSIGVGDVPDVSSDAGIVLTQPNYTGLWLLQQTGQTEYETIEISDTGSAVCRSFDGTALTLDPCTFTLNYQTGSFTLTLTSDGATGSGTLNFLTGLANATVTDSEGTATVSGSRR